MVFLKKIFKIRATRLNSGSAHNPKVTLLVKFLIPIKNHLHVLLPSYTWAKATSTVSIKHRRCLLTLNVTSDSFFMLTRTPSSSFFLQQSSIVNFIHSLFATFVFFLFSFLLISCCLSSFPDSDPRLYLLTKLNHYASHSILLCTSAGSSASCDIFFFFFFVINYNPLTTFFFIVTALDEIS